MHSGILMRLSFIGKESDLQGIAEATRAFLHPDNPYLCGCYRLQDIQKQIRGLWG